MIKFNIMAETEICGCNFFFFAKRISIPNNCFIGISLLEQRFFLFFRYFFRFFSKEFGYVFVIVVLLEMGWRYF